MTRVASGPRRVALVATAVAAAALAGCAGGEKRPANDAGAFRITNALQGEAVVLAPVPVEGALPLVRMVASDEPADTVSHWRLTAFGQGLYRVSSVEAEERLSLAAGYGDAAGATIGGSALGAVGLDLSRRSVSQLWAIAPLGDGHCQLVSALFPDRSLDVADRAAGAPRLAASDDVPGQRWRLAAVEPDAADGLPALCGGESASD